jgi:hypothetical protein
MSIPMPHSIQMEETDFKPNKKKPTAVQSKPKDLDLSPIG